ncbi:MAG: EVE domain-containing protein [Chloroflexi bacterium]|nr:EVE domain-containing protein [Chloroflexota bacterium]
MKYWLCKTEPSVYSYEQLEADRETRWDGVRNPTALIHIRTMAVGDHVVIYHSGDVRSAVGLAEVISAPHPDPEAGDPRWAVVDVRAVKRLEPPVSLSHLKGVPEFAGSPLVRISRLSVLPLTNEQYAVITAARP